MASCGEGISLSAMGHFGVPFFKTTIRFHWFADPGTTREHMSLRALQ
jgi:hypothetical protein